MPAISNWKLVLPPAFLVTVAVREFPVPVPETVMPVGMDAAVPLEFVYVSVNVNVVFVEGVPVNVFVPGIVAG